MVQSLKFKNFLIEDQQKRQLSITAPCLFRNKERASILQIILQKREAVEEVQVNSTNDKVIIKYDTEALLEDDLLDILEDVLENFSQKPREKTKKTSKKCPKCGGFQKEVAFYVDGMSCASCALFVEMTLSRNEKVTEVKVDYKSKKGLVVGCLNRSDVAEIVEKLGFKAQILEE